MTFKELMDKFIAHKKLHREQNTVEVIQYARKKFESLENSEVIKISKADIQYCVDLYVYLKTPSFLNILFLNV